MELEFKVIQDYFSNYGIRVSTDHINQKNIIQNKVKVIHHDHCLENDYSWI